MVARISPRKMVAAPPISPTLLRETVKKVDKCMARLQELQYTVAGGTKVISGVSLSPRSSRNYLRTSLRCKHESLRLKTGNSRKSPPGKLPIQKEEWRKMSLPAMLLGETMGEILEASQFAKNIVQAVCDDPKTPLTERTQKRLKNSELPALRRREKLQTTRSSPPLQRAKSRINFKMSSPPKNRESDKENCRYNLANRVSPKNRPWVKKTVLFPNPLFHSLPTSRHQKFVKTKSPMISRTRLSPPKILTKSPVASRNRNTPHKFLIKTTTPTKSPRSQQNRHKFVIRSPQVKIKSPPLRISPTQVAAKNSPKRASSLSRLRRSFSPSRLAQRLASPLKSRKSVHEGMMKNTSGVKQRPTSFSNRFSPRRI